MTSSTNMVEAQSTDNSPGVSAVTKDTDEDTGNTGDTEEPTNPTDWGSQFITKTQLQNSNGEETNSFGLYDDIYATWFFSTGENTVKNGDTITVDVPAQFTVTDNTTNLNNQKEIKDDNGTIIGNLSLNNTTKKLTLTFNQNAETKNITGKFQLKTQWNKNSYTSAQTVPIEWNITGTATPPDLTGSAEVTVPSEGEDNNKSNLYKFGSFNGENIDWVVEVNYSNEKINDAIYKDFIVNDQTLVPDSVKVNSATYDDKGNVVDTDTNLYEGKNIVNYEPSDGSSFNVNLGDITQPVTIRYSTKITDGTGDGSYSNTGNLLSNKTILNTVNVHEATSNVDGDAHTSDKVISPMGKKIWSVPADSIPDSIIVNLLQNGKSFKEQEVTSDSNWTYIFNNVPEFDSKGNHYTYTVTEDSATLENFVPYANPANYDIINYLPGTFKVTKVWNDNNDSNRPKSIQVQLLADGKESGTPVTVTAADNWTHTFTGLDTNYHYSVKEIPVDGYTSKVNNINNNEAIITNTKETTPPVENTKTLTVKKVWDDKDNQDKLRPDKVTVHLLTNGNASSDSVVLNADNKWTYTWKDLSPDNTYTITEDKVTGYTSSQTTDDDTNTVTLTNTHVPDTKNPNPEKPIPGKPDPNPEKPTPGTPGTPDPTPTPTDPNPETPSGEKDPDPDTPDVDKTPDPIIPTDSFTPDDKTPTPSDFNPVPTVPNVPYSNDQLPQTGNKELNWLYPLIGVMILGLVTFRVKKRA